LNFRISSGKTWSKLLKGKSEAQDSSKVDRSGLLAQGIEPPRVDFKTAWEMYRTIPKIQNAVESVVLDILSRDWYYEGEDESKVKQLEDWEETHNASEIFESLIREWLVCGNHILGFSDWKAVQMQTVIGLERDSGGNIKQFIQQFSNNPQPAKLEAKKFCFSKYIDADREAWGLGAFHSLLETWVNEKGKDSKSLAWIYRDMKQLMYKIIKRFGSPRVIWGFDGIDKDVFDKDVAPLVESMEEGDRLALGKTPQLIQESVDGKGRFSEYITDIGKEMDVGLQSSANRLITEPSAMADAREANRKDDSRVLGIMEKIRRLMNDVIIPKILEEKGSVEFKWGTKDSFNLEFPPSLQAAINTGTINQKIARHILKNHLRWNIPEDMLKELDDEYEKDKKTQDVGNFDPDNPSQPKAKKFDKSKNDYDPEEERMERIKTYRKIREALDKDGNP
jgi:hypothetical protein